MNGIRHLLVVASQCRQMPVLAGLDQAAQAIRDALRDPTAGACEAGLADDTDLRCGEVPSAEVVDTVRSAVRHAGRRRATLVLVLIGHGFVPGQAPRLYFMGKDSRDQDRQSAVDLQSLVLEAVDHAGVDGVLAVVDTCMAAGAIPPVAELLAGVRGGRTRLAMLASAAVDQAAYDLRASRELSRLVRQGVPEQGPVLDLPNLLAPLREAAPGQDLAAFQYEGDPSATTGLWLCRNRRHIPVGGRSLVGPVGRGQLAEVLAEVDLPDLERADDRLDATTLGELARQLRTGAPEPARDRALRTVEILRATTTTVDLLRRWLPHALTTPLLRRALANTDAARRGLGPTVAGSGLATETEFVEHVALHWVPIDDSYQSVLASYVVALALEAEMDLAATELRDWATAIGATVQLNDAIVRLRSSRSGQRLWLVVSLHAALSGLGWPEEVDAWLLRDGELSDREILPCHPDRSGVEDALREAVTWAEERAADQCLKLSRLDVAVPTGLLLWWHPEEVEHGTKLGIDYEVNTRWSTRLNPPREIEWVNRHADRILADLEDPSQRTVHWLDESQTRDLTDLHRRLRNGGYAGPIGLLRHPGDEPALLDLLLAYTPILLWPRWDNLPGDRFAEAVAEHFDRMPGALRTAYRRRWREDAKETLAELRTVWEDREWLRFCARYRADTRMGG